MSRAFCPLLVVVKGETPEDGFLPYGNYLSINEKFYPLGHCFTLQLPIGDCDIVVYTQPPYEIQHANIEIQDGYSYSLTLTVDGSRNITDAIFGYEEITEDPFELHALNCKKAEENTAKISQWRSTFTQPAIHRGVLDSPASGSPAVRTKRRGGKLIGWGLAILLFFALGIILTCTGNIELTSSEITDNFSLSNIAVYIGGAVIGLIMFVIGLIRRANDN